MKFNELLEEAEKSPEYHEELAEIEAREADLPSWRIVNPASGRVLGEYKAETEEQALDVMAREAGYRDYEHCQSEVPGELSYEVVAG